jgi:2-dehydropantoate 2-reductase
MRYGIVGVGPVGAFFAALLKQAGHEVSACCHSQEQKERLSAGPLKVFGAAAAEARVDRIAASVEEFAVDPPDVVLICVKGWQSPELLRRIKAAAPDIRSAFVSCQNGLDVERQIAEVFGEERAYRMVLHFGCSFTGTNEVRVAFLRPSFLSNKTGDAGLARSVARDLNRAGIPTRLTFHCRREAFKKSVLNSSLGTICSLTRQTMDEVMADPELVRMVEEAVRESAAVGRAMGLGVEPDFPRQAMAYLAETGAHKPSMALDMERVRPTENEFLAGALFHEAEERGVDAPVLQTLYYLTKNLERHSLAEHKIPALLG